MEAYDAKVSCPPTLQSIAFRSSSRFNPWYFASHSGSAASSSGPSTKIAFSAKRDATR
jgi:hypothetical protein